ncbi:hypothetical protein KC330_g8984 [Hortaea werneckii]|nr:hypothetical protein KC330_g8984 [Hortaea werneckii]
MTSRQHQQRGFSKLRSNATQDKSSTSTHSKDRHGYLRHTVEPAVRRTTERLEQIAKLRSCGIGEHVDLPQLIVCGDQSAGKSSVLEGITGLPFPKKDGLCTNFATEIMLIPDEGGMTMQARMIPSVARSGRPREELMAYERSLDDLGDLPHVITEAGTLMGLRGFGRTQRAEFAAGVLRITISGPTRLNLTVIDLHGLISATNAEQGKDDMRMVHELVDSYVQNPRAIILAVVQASNDIANQSIIQKSKRFDQTGGRTVGIITKADLVIIGTEGRVAALSKNQDEMRLKLGNEENFFARSHWNQYQLRKERLGASNLRGFSQQLLDDHIGPDALFFANPSCKRQYVRLRAFVHKANTCFANELRLHEATFKVYQSTRGRELPGHYNHVLLNELFHKQSDRWKSFATVHLSHLVHSIQTFVADALTYLNADEQKRREISSRISESLARHCAMARKALKKAFLEEYNKKLRISNTTVDAEKFLGALQRRVLVDMDQ